MNRTILAALAAAVLALPALAQTTITLGPAGLLSRENRQKLEPLTLGAGQPLAAGPIRLKSGFYYKLPIVSDGSQELQIAAPEFFRAIWIDEVVINNIEVRPLGLDSLEFDDEGEAEIGFVAIKPGTYTIRVPGTEAESMRVEVTIE